MRWLIAVAVLLGITAGFLFPERGAAHRTGQLFDTWYLISAGSTGQVVPFNCSWHTNCLVERSGIGLDFGPVDVLSAIEFRGVFKRSGPAAYDLHTHQYSVADQPDRCHEFATDVHENHIEYSHGLHLPRWGMHYVHGRIRSGLPYAFSIYHTSQTWGYYNSFFVGTMVPEDPSYCSWSGPHVHDLMLMGPYPVGLSGYEARGDMFRIQDEGTYYQNNAHWTRRLQWGEGAQQ